MSCVTRMSNIRWSVDELANETIEELLQAVGAALAFEGETIAILVVGGASLIMRGFVPRVTKDVDVIALAERHGDAWVLHPPHPWPETLQRAARRVAGDYGLPADWLNAAIGGQWAIGLPESLPQDVEWRAYDGLTVGFAGRSTLIALKLVASADQSPRSVHYQDLRALAPSPSELRTAAEWVLTQDASPEFASILNDVLRHYRAGN